MISQNAIVMAVLILVAMILMSISTLGIGREEFVSIVKVTRLVTSARFVLTVFILIHLLKSLTVKVSIIHLFNVFKCF